MLSKRLKEETHSGHIAVEKLIIPQIKKINSAHSYCRLLSVFYGYFNPLEKKIEQYFDRDVFGDIYERRKSQTIIEDMVFLGETEPGYLCDDVPEIKGVPESLGAMYVLEGSTLGGQFISKMIAETLAFKTVTGTRFFSGYGTDTPAKWEVFKARLDGYTNDIEVENKIIHTANQTFSKFKSWIERNQRNSEEKY